MIILVSSFDERSFAWKPFAHGMEKYWYDCPWKVKFMTNKLDAPMGWESIKIPESTDWVYMMKRALEQIEDKTILFMIEDYWITYPVLTKDIIDFYEIVESDKADYIKLMPSPDAKNPTIDERLGEFNKDALYRTSLNMSIWNTEVLYNLLEDGESIWQFETQAGKRLPNSAVMLAVRDKIYLRIVEGEDGWESSSAVEQGKLTDAGRRYISEEQI